MAWIDKTYTTSYSDYKEFKDWANKQTITFFNGYKVCVGNWVWDFEEEDFDGREIPIMNTPIWLDIFLIQNCKIQFVLDRMKEVYDEGSYTKFQTIDLSAKLPLDFQQNRKITIKRYDKTKFPLHKKPYGGGSWWLQSKDDFWYHDETRTWTSYDSHYPHNTNTSHSKTLKAVVRHLRKQYLPKGVTFTLIGRFVGEVYLVVIK